MPEWSQLNTYGGQDQAPDSKDDVCQYRIPLSLTLKDKGVDRPMNCLVNR